MPFPSYEEHLRQVHRYALSEGFLHGWPSFEQAVYPDPGLVYGAYFLRSGDYVEYREIYRHELADSPELGDISAVWRSVSRWAWERGYVTGVPTFEAGDHGHGVFYGAILLKPGPYIEYQEPYRAELDDQPDLGDAGACIRSINRWFYRHGFAGGFPNFEAGDRGQGVFYGGFGLRNDGYLVAHDVPDSILHGSPASVYEVWVKTADEEDAGTDGNIFLTMYGELGESRPVRLNSLINRDAFERNSQEWISITAEPRLGRIGLIHLHNSMSGWRPAWRLEAIEIAPRYPSDPLSVFRYNDLVAGEDVDILAEDWPQFEGARTGSLTLEKWKHYDLLLHDLPIPEDSVIEHKIEHQVEVSTEVTNTTQLSMESSWKSPTTKVGEFGAKLAASWQQIIKDRRLRTDTETLDLKITVHITYPPRKLTLVRVSWKTNWILSLTRFGVTTCGLRSLAEEPIESREVASFAQGDHVPEPFATYIRQELPHLSPLFQF